MISLEEIKKVRFRKSALGGYKPDDVEDFIDRVQTSYEQLLDEKVSLTAKVRDLDAKLEKFYSEESAIKTAIVNAQKLADESLANAKQKAEKIINDARKRSKSMNGDYETFCKQTLEFKQKLTEIYKKQLTLLGEIPVEAEVKRFDNTQKNVSQSDFEKTFERESKKILETKKEILPYAAEEVVGGKNVLQDVGANNQNVGISNDKDIFSTLEFGENCQLKIETKQSDNCDESGIFGGVLKRLRKNKQK